MKLSSIKSNIFEDKSGATAIEYGLILALVVLAMLVALNSLASETVSIWDMISDKSENAISGQ
ncbi:Flp family type IVb pilin [Novosphingobium lindaniclasticum]|uniref:Flp family type IVb pilin n=1 Tax=Novosphingobium lindaniclasticum LE124 TaxID=1096930 RepID=T0I6Q1_9SPHN|nr:Flp family type IVb pilin [Novosphingobium lindaniclasticum]EQB07325.1 hypothetical protein L284_23285 [Novosphingobium lindaniclasticum LE124]